MAALAGGIAALILGIIGIIVWWGEFIGLLMGGVPLILILGGALAAYLGFEEMKDKRTAEKFEDKNEDNSEDKLQKEVEELKKEIKELKVDKPKPEEDKNTESSE